MKSSLRNRFLGISAIVNFVALLAAGFAVYLLFESYVTTKQNSEIRHHLVQLIGGLEIEGDGPPTISVSLAEPRFDQPTSGLYWQVEDAQRPVLRSESLWDATLSMPKLPLSSQETPQLVMGPFGEPLLVQAQLVTIGTPPNQRQLRVMVGVNEDEVSAPLKRFAIFLAASLTVIGLTFIVVSSVQFRIVMSPVGRLRQNIRDIRDGRVTRMSDDYPVEFSPLVEKLNLLLAQQSVLIEKARSRAGNFAHGIKTPLTVIDVLLSELKESDKTATAAEIAAQTAVLRQLADRELARTRLAAGYGKPVQDLRFAIDDIVATMKRLPRGDTITFRNQIPAGQTALIDQEDFTELAGNLLDNARKWARSIIVIELHGFGNTRRLSIADDGPGIPDSEVTTISNRGRRLDERAQGSGIGLAIVKDITDAYNLDTHFTKSAFGGLEVSVALSE